MNQAAPAAIAPRRHAADRTGTVQAQKIPRSSLLYRSVRLGLDHV